jgi:hypothetical protein
VGNYLIFNTAAHHFSMMKSAWGGLSASDVSEVSGLDYSKTNSG